MEDVLDEWSTARLKLKINGVDALVCLEKVCSFFPAASCFGCNPLVLCRDIALKVREINESLDDIAKQKDQFGFAVNVIKSNERADERVPSISSIDESEIFGREKEKSELVNRLLCESSKEQKGPCVISLVGMGGIGKTTLAQFAYNNDDVKKNFEERIWVCVSEAFDVFRIARAIIEALTYSSSNFVEFQSLMQHIQKHVAGKKLLLVLDDVWNEDFYKWEQFYNCLKTCLHGSKILITTRKETVARIMGSADIISVNVLSETECWLVFESLGFSGKSMEERENLEKIGREIIRKCKGLPLVAKTIASLLRSKNTEKEWQNILESEIWEIEEVEKNLLAPLLLSYNELPSKHCPISFFRRQRSRNCTFGGDVLFFENVTERRQERTGLRYATFPTSRLSEEFSNRAAAISQLHSPTATERYRKETGENWPKICHIPCININSVDDKGEPFIEARAIIEALKPGSTKDLVEFQSLMQHIQECVEGEKFLLVLDDLWNKDYYKWEPFYNCLKNGLHGSKILITTRKSMEGRENLEKIGREIVGKCKGLPLAVKTIGSLLRSKNNEEEWKNILESEIWEHEVVKKGLLAPLLLSYNELPSKILAGRDWGINQSSEVTKFVVGGGYGGACSLGSLKKLNLLRECWICGRGGVSDAGEARRAELEQKKNLLKLGLHFCHSRDGDEEQAGRRENEEDEAERLLEALGPPPNLKELRIHEYRGRRNVVPINWIMSLTNLRDLYLSYCRNCEHLPPLGKLPSLEDLHILGMESVKRVGNKFLGVESDTDGSSVIAFPKLKRLAFHTMEELEEWDFRTAIKGEIIIMPRLSSLSIDDCPKLKALPDRLLQKTTLQRLEIYGCPILEERCRKETGEDWPKIRHIPDIEIE
ncbi:hypothetical protein KPL70_015403 [Citrus sinensis]|nr:hypothetical protein KPL70_015403 [Citrus sinensis]